MPAKNTVKAKQVKNEPIEVKRSAGRPKAELNWPVFEELCYIQCTQQEIANVLRVHADTVKTRAEEHYGMSYAEVYKQFSDGGKSSLRRIQFKMAERNASMAIWLGKQYLNQRDLPVEESTKTKTAFDEFNELMKRIYFQNKTEIEAA